MADLTPTAVSKSSNFVTGSGGDTTADICSDLLDNRTEIYSLLTTIRKQQYGATPPSNPNTGDTWRCSTTAGLYVANVTYRWSGTAWVEETASSINTTARNVVIQGAVTTAGATALFTGSTAALTVQLNATTTPAVFTWMDGNDGVSGKVDYVGTVTEDSTSFWSSLPQNSTVYLYVDFDGTSTISGGFSTVAPVYQNYAPSVTATGTHWIDDNLGQVLVTNGSAWSKVYRVFVGTATTDATKVTAVSIYDYNALRQNIVGNVTGTASGNVANSLYDANTILYATTDNTPEALTVGASTFVGRKSTGNISAMTVSEANALLGIASKIRAWVIFDGTGTPSIKYYYNVSSITDYGTGKYGINFSSNMADVNCVVLLTGVHDEGSYACQPYLSNDDTPISVSNIRINCLNPVGVLQDGSYISVLVVGV